MGTTLLRLAVYLCLACFVYSLDSEFILTDAQQNQWYEIGSNVTLDCQWQHDYNRTVEVTWIEDVNSIRKITEGSPKNTFIYRPYKPEECGDDCKQPDSTRQEETHNFDDKVAKGEWREQYSIWTIFNFNLNDPTSYVCRVELRDLEQITTFDVNLYARPNLTVLDVVTRADIRTPAPTAEPETTTPEFDGSESEPDNYYGGETADTENEYGTETEGETEDGETGTSDAGSNTETGGDNNGGSDTGETGEFIGDADDMMADDPVALEQKIVVKCRIEGAYPRPMVFFRVAEGDRMEPSRAINWETGGDKETWTGTATLELEADPMYDGKAVTCFAELRTEPETTFEAKSPSSAIEILHDVSTVRTVISPAVANAWDSVEIRCDSNGNPGPTFEIATDATDVPSFEKSDDGRHFTISRVTRANEGSYWCVATLPERTEDASELQTMESENRPTLKVHYIEDPSLSQESDFTMTAGESRTITCTGNANPATSPVWKKDGNEKSGSGTLTIEKAAYEDAGKYTCETTNEVGTTTKSITINVEGGCKATFREPVISSSTEEGFYLKLQCGAVGSPRCTVDITPQSNFNVAGTKKEENGDTILEFASLEQLAAPVQFFCHAYNNIGKADNISTTINEQSGGDEHNVCCAVPQTAGLSVGAIVGIIFLVLVVIIGVPVACYCVKKRNTQPAKKAPKDAEAADPEKEGLNKEGSSQDSDTGSLPPPPPDLDGDHRLGNEMTTFSSNQEQKTEET